MTAHSGHFQKAARLYLIEGLDLPTIAEQMNINEKKVVRLLHEQKIWVGEESHEKFESSIREEGYNSIAQALADLWHEPTKALTERFGLSGSRIRHLYHILTGLSRNT